MTFVFTPKVNQIYKMLRIFENYIYTTYFNNLKFSTYDEPKSLLDGLEKKHKLLKICLTKEEMLEFKKEYLKEENE